VRVPVYLRDQATVQCRFTDARQFWDAERERLVITDAGATLTNGNRPGWRVADTAINRQAKMDAYRSYHDDLVNAWKNPSTWRKP
jgi:hypothetical protein